MKRIEYLQQIQASLENFPVVALLGPRQSGKTTTARQFAEKQKKPVHYFDLENMTDLAALEDAQLTLESLEGLIIIDEVQRRPELFQVLRVLADVENSKQQFLILGSASPHLLQQSSETLAGRIAYIELMPFSIVEVQEIDKLWLQGGFPKSYLANSQEVSWQWREFYMRTYFEQDIPNLGINIPATTLRRFWTMLAQYHGNVFNAAEFARSFAISSTTVKKYLDILTDTFMVRQLQPYHANVIKRQVKSPKIYFRDSGLLHLLFDAPNFDLLHRNPKVGASWEGFVIESIVEVFNAASHQIFFWATHSGAELDLLLKQPGRL